MEPIIFIDIVETIKYKEFHTIKKLYNITKTIAYATDIPSCPSFSNQPSENLAGNGSC